MVDSSLVGTDSLPYEGLVGNSASCNLLNPTSPTFYYFFNFLKKSSEEVSDFFIYDFRDHKEFLFQCDLLPISWRLASRLVGKMKLFVGNMPKFQNAWRGLSLIL